MTLTRRHLLALSAAAPFALRSAPLADVHLGVTTDEIDDDPAVAAAFLKSFGLGYAEIRNLWGKYNTSIPPERCQEARRIFDDNGIRVSIVDTAFFRGAVPSDDAALAKEWQLLDDAMARARIFGAGLLRTFSFMKPKAGSAADPWPRIFDLQNQAAARAAKAGIRLAVENLGGSYVSRGVDSALLLKNVKASNFGLTWDPNNAAQSGEQSFPGGYRQLDPARIFHVHLRDFKHLPDGKVEWTAVGEGEFDNLGQLRALRRDGYRGAYTLETHWRGPGGKAASTRTSLTKLLEIVRES